jgi:2-oxoglutarate ferredoxin oxidoreductase subunit alpha
MSHGDTKHVLLFPSTVDDCYRFGMEAFDLAERLQTPVIVMSDLDLGMNVWMSDPFAYPEAPWDRGKVLDDDALAKVKTFERYRDVDGDGIPYRTLPGQKDPKAAYFTRGSGHDEQARYTESSAAYPRIMDRLSKKYETARRLAPGPVVDRAPRATVGLFSYGSTAWAMEEARDLLREDGVETSHLLLKAYPFHPDVRAFVASCERVYVVEQNRDAQMAALLRHDMPDLAPRIRSVLHYDGLPIDARSIADGVRAVEREEVAAR